MDTSLQLNPGTASIQPTAPVTERAITTRVAQIAKGDGATTLPSDRPFLAQAVVARLNSNDYPDPPTEIAPPERTLRPYDVPMLPFDKPDEATQTEAGSLLSDAEPRDR